MEICRTVFVLRATTGVSQQNDNSISPSINLYGPYQNEQRGVNKLCVNILPETKFCVGVTCDYLDACPFYLFLEKNHIR